MYVLFILFKTFCLFYLKIFFSKKNYHIVLDIFHDEKTLHFTIKPRKSQQNQRCPQFCLLLNNIIFFDLVKNLIPHIVMLQEYFHNFDVN